MPNRKRPVRFRMAITGRQPFIQVASEATAGIRAKLRCSLRTELDAYRMPKDQANAGRKAAVSKLLDSLELVNGQLFQLVRNETHAH